jgi:hypothetical protein
MTRCHTAGRIGAALLSICAAVPSLASGEQAAQTSAPQPAAARPPQMTAQGTPMAATTRRPGALRGFSVVLVMGDLQGTSATDDVPVAARKALNDMREFLPYKSYRLLDAGWLMCCGDEARPASADSNLALRGPDEQEYEVKLSTARTDTGRVLVRRFALLSQGSSAEAASPQSVRALQRRLADLEDRMQLKQHQIAEARRRAEVGTAPAAEIPKMEVELRAMQREMEEMRERIASGGRSGAARETAPRMAQSSAVIDTSFTMDVGETVVVGASRPKGATKALIALVTAVPRSGSGAARD